MLPVPLLVAVIPSMAGDLGFPSVSESGSGFSSMVKVSGFLLSVRSRITKTQVTELPAVQQQTSTCGFQSRALAASWPLSNIPFPFASSASPVFVTNSLH